MRIGFCRAGNMMLTDCAKVQGATEYMPASPAVSHAKGQRNMTSGAVVSSHAWSAEKPSKSREALRQVPVDLSIRHQIGCNRPVLDVIKDEPPARVRALIVSVETRTPLYGIRKMTCRIFSGGATRHSACGSPPPQIPRQAVDRQR